MKAILNELFPFEYVGGGYFRLKGAPKGKSAPLLHGMEAIKYVFDAINKNESENITVIEK